MAQAISFAGIRALRNQKVEPHEKRPREDPAKGRLFSTHSREGGQICCVSARKDAGCERRNVGQASSLRVSCPTKTVRPNGRRAGCPPAPQTGCLRHVARAAANHSPTTERLCYFVLAVGTGGRLCVPAANLAFSSAAVARNVSRPFGTPRYSLPVFFAKPACTKFCSFS